MAEPQGFTHNERLFWGTANGFLAPWMLMFGLHGFGINAGYWSLFWITSSLEAAISSVMWSLPLYLKVKERNRG